MTTDTNGKGVVSGTDGTADIAEAGEQKRTSYMNTSTNTKEIATALAAAQGEFRSVQKSGNNTYDRYKYAKLEDYVEAVGNVLPKHGLSRLASVEEIIPMDDRETQNGKKEHVVRVKLVLRIMHTSGEWIEMPSYGEGQDRADKAIYKAITGAHKYALASALGLATTDDPENDDRKPETPQQPTRQPQRPAPPQRQAPARPPEQAPSVAATAPREIVNEETGEVTTEHDAGDVTVATAEQNAQFAELLAKLPNAAKLAQGACSQHGVKRLSELTTEHAAAVLENFRSLAAGAKATPRRKAG